MPELPDVEVLRKYFNKTSLNKKIIKIDIFVPNLIKGISAANFKRKLKNKFFISTFRRGKFLIVYVKGLKEKLVFHFGMTGNFIYSKEEKKFAKVVFHFNDYKLQWINIRKFGKIYFVKDTNEIKTIRNMGPEPLVVGEKEFPDLMKKHKNRNIKSFLLEQSIIAGIGNIYADEILFHSRVKPNRKISSLNGKERKRIFKEMKNVLKKANKVDAKIWKIKYFLAPNRGEKCPKCKESLKSIKINARTTYYCNKCQK